MLELPELQQQQQQIQQQSMPKASLIIDGGHLQHAMKKATIAFYLQITHNDATSTGTTFKSTQSN